MATLIPYASEQKNNLAMIPMELHIKNMVCPRCIWVVKNELPKLGIRLISIQMGQVNVLVPVSVTTRIIEAKLNEFGFELLKAKDEVLVEQIKLAIGDYLKQLEEKRLDKVMSDYLWEQIGKNYNYLSKIFSQHEGQTIEEFYIRSKINRVKELLNYNELNLSEIARLLGYSSVQYLSSQFRKVTGQSVSAYKKIL